MRRLRSGLREPRRGHAQVRPSRIAAVMSPPSLGWSIRDPIRFGSPRDSGHWSRCNRRTSRDTTKRLHRTRGTARTPGFLLSAPPWRTPETVNQGLDYADSATSTPLSNNSPCSSKMPRLSGSRKGVLWRPVPGLSCSPRHPYAGLAEWLRLLPSKQCTRVRFP